MWALRFGSYSRRSTGRHDAVLVALEIDHAVMLLVAAATWRVVMRPMLLRPPVRVCFSSSGA
jgi:hypothetical protein